MSKITYKDNIQCYCGGISQLHKIKKNKANKNMEFWKCLFELYKYKYETHKRESFIIVTIQSIKIFNLELYASWEKYKLNWKYH